MSTIIFITSLYYYLHYAVRSSLNWLGTQLPPERLAPLGPLFFITYFLGQLVAGKLIDRLGVQKTLGLSGAVFTGGAWVCYKGAFSLGFALMGGSSAAFFIAGVYNILGLPPFMRGYCMDILSTLGGLGTLTSSAAVLQVTQVEVARFFQFILGLAGGLTLLVGTGVRPQGPIAAVSLAGRREYPWLSATFSALTLNAVALVSDAYGSTLWRTFPRIDVWAFLLVISIISSLGFFVLRAVMSILQRTFTALLRPTDPATRALLLVLQPYLLAGCLGVSSLALLSRLWHATGSNYLLMIVTGATLAFYAVSRLVFLTSYLGHLPLGREAFTIAIWNSFNALGRVVAELYLWIRGSSTAALRELVSAYLLLSLAVLLALCYRTLLQAKNRQTD